MKIKKPEEYSLDELNEIVSHNRSRHLTRYEVMGHSQRRKTKKYKIKKSKCKNVWIYFGCLSAIMPNPALILTFVFCATFLSFTILDETF